MANLPKAVIGVDPGITGCVFLITENRTARYVRLMQYEPRLWLPALKPLFAEHQIVKVLQERTSGRRGDKPNIAETFGRNTGMLITALWYHMPKEMEIEFIQDQKWQRIQAVSGIKNRGDRIRKYQEKLQKKFSDLKVTQDMGAAGLIADTAWDSVWGF